MAAKISIKQCLTHNACAEGVIRALRSKPDSKSIDEPLALHELHMCVVSDLLWAVELRRGALAAGDLCLEYNYAGSQMREDNPFRVVHRRNILNDLLRNA